MRILYSLLSFSGLAQENTGKNTGISKLDIDREMEISGIEPVQLLARRLPQQMMNNTGPGMREKVFQMQRLYQKHKATGLNAQETSSLLSIRKLMQLKSMVTSLIGDASINFDRFCFYGCYCLPDAAIHDASPGVGKPVDEIDNACKELKMCYQCANRDTKEETGGECEQDMAYSVQPISGYGGGIVDHECMNTEDTCRWRICQCDRAFAHKMKQKYDMWSASNHAVEGGFNRGSCEIETRGAGAPRECCGDYAAPFHTQQRQLINTNYQQCCSNQKIKNYGDVCSLR